MIGILSDAHGNCDAFLRGLTLLEGMGATRFFFLGDAVGYFPGDRVIEHLTSIGHKITCVRGNHDQMLIDKNWLKDCEPLYQHDRTAKFIAPESENELKSWPLSYWLKSELGDALFIHGGPRDFLNQYIYPNTFIGPNETSAEFVFMGHTHRPFIRQAHGTLFVNVGSCGLPRDHGTLGSVCLFDPSTGQVNIFRYDIGDIMQKAAKKGIIHPDIVSFFKRKPKDYVGQILSIKE